MDKVFRKIDSKEKFVLISDHSLMPWVPNFCLGPQPHLIVCRESIAKKYEGARNVPQSEYLVMSSCTLVEITEGLSYSEIEAARQADKDKGESINWELSQSKFKLEYIDSPDPNNKTQTDLEDNSDMVKIAHEGRTNWVHRDDIPEGASVLIEGVDYEL